MMTATIVERIKKRDGRIKRFDPQKIKIAIDSAFQATYNMSKEQEANELMEKVVEKLNQEGKKTQEGKKQDLIVNRLQSFLE